MVNDNRSKQMKVQVRGVNYTGHHFRNMDCAYDGKTVDITLIGNDEQIVKFVLDNFDWGGDASRFPLVSDLCNALGNDWRLADEGDDCSFGLGHDDGEDEEDDDGLDEDGNPMHMQLGQFDGAGGVVWIKDEAGDELFVVGDLEYFAGDKVIELGEVSLDDLDAWKDKHEMVEAGYSDYVNQRVREIVESK
jgi:hypothetical protein